MKHNTTMKSEVHSLVTQYLATYVNINTYQAQQYLTRKLYVWPLALDVSVVIKEEFLVFFYPVKQYFPQAPFRGNIF